MKTFKQFYNKPDKNPMIMHIHFKMNNKKHNHESYVQEENGVKDEHKSWLIQNDNSHIAKKVSDVSNHLANQLPLLSDEQHRAIHSYTIQSRDLNKKLISGEKLPDYKQEQVNHIDSVANHPAPEHHYLYSGLGHGLARAIAGAAGREIKLPAFTSLTLHKKIAKSFAHDSAYYNDNTYKLVPNGQQQFHYLSLHVKKGQKVAHIVQHSNKPKEMESILPRNTRIRVDPSPSSHVDSDGNTHHIWHAEISHQD